MTTCIQKHSLGVPVVAQVVKDLMLSPGGCGFNPPLPSLSGLRIRRCRKLWQRLQMQLRSGVVAVA